jgi:hypothetical protein
VNVTKRFAIAIRWGFWMSAANIGRSILAQVAIRIKSWFLLYASYLLFAVNFTLILILFIFINLWRWDHPGMVCAGHYLAPEFRNTVDAPGYLIVEGRFLMWILIILYSILGLGCYSVCFVTLFLAQKKSKEQLEKE